MKNRENFIFKFVVSRMELKSAMQFKKDSKMNCKTDS